VAGEAVIRAAGPVSAGIGTFMVGDPKTRVQSMMLAEPCVGQAAHLRATGPGTVGVTLYGPVPPVTGEGCVGVDWSDAGSLPVARVFDTIVTHNQVTGGEEPVSHGLGAPEELVLVRSAARDAASRDPARGPRPSQVALAKSGDSVTVRGGLSGKYGNRSVNRSTSHTPRRSQERSTHLPQFRDKRHVRSVRSSRWTPRARAAAPRTAR
jgi:hypothetical protein